MALYITLNPWFVFFFWCFLLVREKQDGFNDSIVDIKAVQNYYSSHSVPLPMSFTEKKERAQKRECQIMCIK